MRRYVIEREVEGIGSVSQQQMLEGGCNSNAALAELAPDVQWMHSYVTENKTFCVYLAKDEDVIRRHAEMSGFPANTITEVKNMIGPLTAHGRV
jgi:hypothetical protein